MIQFKLFIFSFIPGVYAWIGINFVLGRFNHVHNGKRFFTLSSSSVEWFSYEDRQMAISCVSCHGR